MAPRPHQPGPTRVSRIIRLRKEKPSDLLDPDALLRRPGARLLVLAPHPDDESLAAGGLIQRALGYGVPACVVFVTDGENNPWPQRALERRVWIGPRQRRAWGARRRDEADAALRVLGGGAVEVIRLGWPDGGVTWRLLDATVASIAVFGTVIENVRPTVLVLPDLADRHPDHSAVHVLLDMALRALPGVAKPVCLGYLLHGRSHAGLPCRAVLALNAGEQARKRGAIEAHASQVVLARRRLLRSAGPAESFVAGLTPQGTVGARLPWLPPRPLRPCLRLLAVDATGGERIRLQGRGRANVYWRDGSPAACTARALQAPFYAKLYCPLPSPWVFDGWGWCRLDA